MNTFTHWNMALRSPLIKATNNGAPTHAGTKYSRAGCACRYLCITNIVVKRPIIYAKNEVLK